MSERSEFDLLQAWRAGDKQAGSDLLGRHFAAVFLFFRNKVPEVASDLAQQTFLAAVEARDRIDEHRSFRAYLFGIARNRLFMHLRKQQRHDTQHLGDVSVAALGGSPSRELADREEQRLLLAALRQIPLDHQIALELYYWEELAVAEIAEVLGVAEGTVRSRLTRAREQLRQAIGQLEGSQAVLTSTVKDLDRWARSLRDLLTPDADP